MNLSITYTGIESETLVMSSTIIMSFIDMTMQTQSNSVILRQTPSHPPETQLSSVKLHCLLHQTQSYPQANSVIFIHTPSYPQSNSVILRQLSGTPSGENNRVVNTMHIKEGGKITTQ